MDHTLAKAQTRQLQERKLPIITNSDARCRSAPAVAVAVCVCLIRGTALLKYQLYTVVLSPSGFRFAGEDCPHSSLALTSTHDILEHVF